MHWRTGRARRFALAGRAAWVVMALAAALSAEAAPPPTVTFDVRGLTWDELCTVEALQGLANRRGPRLYLDHGEPADRRWLAIYAERAGLRYERVGSLRELLRRFRHVAPKAVVYDAANDGCRYAAITAAGVVGLLPVAEPVLEGDTPALRGSGPPAPLGLAVALDLRGRFPDTIAAYEWALSELMPRCSRMLAHSVDGGRVDGILTGVCGPMSGFDWQTQNRGFVFNLGSQATKMTSYGAEVGGNPAHAAMVERVLRALEPPAQICGYGDPEDHFCVLISRHGHYSFHAYHNWSFHSRVPVRSSRLRPALLHTPRDVRPEPDKVYVCFMTSEGDTMKGPLPFFYESWFDPARGSVPVNWGVNPLMARLFPAMLDYYYATATPNDGFFAGPSGAGYTYPDVMPDPAAFGRHTGAYGRLAGIACFDLWGAGVPGVLERYGAAARPLGLSTFTSPARLWFLSDGTPVAHHELGYWQTDGLGGANWTTVFADPARRAEAVRRLVGRIERIARRVRPPTIVLVYGDLHHYDRHASLYAEVARALDPARFKPARLDEAFSAIRAWASRRVMAGSLGVNDRLSWAAFEGTETRLAVTLTNGRSRATSVEMVPRTGGAPSRLVLRPRERREVVLARVPSGATPPGALAVALRAAGEEDLLDGPVARVPGGERYAGATCVAVWGSDTLLHPTGAAVEDPAGLRGTVWRSPEPAGRYECLVCGPYAGMPAGRYAVAFRLRRDGGSDADPPAVTLDVASGGYAATAGVRGTRALRAGELGAPGEWRWHVVEADWTGEPNLMEARVWNHGAVPLSVDRVAVFRIEPDR